MEYCQLGNSQLKISRIVFGAWAIGGWMWGGTDEQDSIEAIQASIDSGINMIDTAAIYGMGLSETLVGKAIKGRREKVFIATKCGFRWDSEEGSDPWVQTDTQGNTFTIRKNSRPESIFYECDHSLKRLGIDAIDLYQIHAPDTSTPIEDAWNAMVKLLRQGKVKTIGVSNFNLEQLEKAQSIHPVTSLQPPYSLLRRKIENDLAPFCHKHRIGIIGYSPLERGLLTGKVTMDRQFPPGDHRSTHPYYIPKNRRHVLDALDQIEPIAKRHQATISQIILQATLNMNIIDAVIVGARNRAQAIENAKAATIKLSQEEFRFIAETINPKIIVL